MLYSFSAFWNLIGTKANKTDPIRPLLPAISSEGARTPCAPRLDPPMNGVWRLEDAGVVKVEDAGMRR